MSRLQRIEELEQASAKLSLNTQYVHFHIGVSLVLVEMIFFAYNRIVKLQVVQKNCGLQTYLHWNNLSQNYALTMAEVVRVVSHYGSPCYWIFVISENNYNACQEMTFSGNCKVRHLDQYAPFEVELVENVPSQALIPVESIDLIPVLPVSPFLQCDQMQLTAVEVVLVAVRKVVIHLTVLEPLLLSSWEFQAVHKSWCCSENERGKSYFYLEVEVAHPDLST